MKKIVMLFVIVGLILTMVGCGLIHEETVIRSGIDGDEYVTTLVDGVETKTEHIVTSYEMDENDKPVRVTTVTTWENVDVESWD